MKEIKIASLSLLSDVAEEILGALDGRTVVLLDGPMGSGKTTLVREIAALMGSEDNVTSPTFAIVNEYVVDRDDVIYHFDMYRIEKIAEALDLGFNEYINSGRLCFIEWAQKVEELLPDDAMLVRIKDEGEQARSFIID